MCRFHKLLGEKISGKHVSCVLPLVLHVLVNKVDLFK